MKTLHLTLKRKWFDLIASGEKKEEYREIKPYWEQRFTPTYVLNQNDKPKSVLHQGFNILLVGNTWDTVTFRNGYAKNAPTIVVQFLGISVGAAKPEWSDNWQGEVFILKLGEVIKN